MSRFSSYVRARISDVRQWVGQRACLWVSHWVRTRKAALDDTTATLVDDVMTGRYTAENLRAVHALATRRFDATALPGAPQIPVHWPDVDVSIVAQNNCTQVERFVDALLAQRYPLERLHLYITDNGSLDGTIDALAAALAPHRARFGSVSIRPQRHGGLGAGHHQNLVAGSSAWCLVIDLGVALYPDALEHTVMAALDPSSAPVASWEMRQTPCEHPKHYDPVTLETNWSPHACVLLRRSAYEAAGGYDPRILREGYDIELSYRFRSFGYALKYVPRARVLNDALRPAPGTQALNHALGYMAGEAALNYSGALAGAIDPNHFTDSTLTNLYLRLRYGDAADRAAVLFMYGRLLDMPIPFPGARRYFLASGYRLLRNWRHFAQGRGPVAAHFPFRGFFEYDMTREGASYAAVAADRTPLVSVITRTYQGRGTLLNQAMQSVFNQTWPAIELIVVQDGGDSLQAQVMAAAERAPAGCSVRFVANPKLGRSAAGNAGLAATTGPYVMFLDDDDLLYADHIETLAGVLTREASVSAAYALATEVLTAMHDSGRYTETSFRTPKEFFQEWDHTVMLDHNFIPIQAILFRRTLFETRGGFDTALDELEDWHLWLRYGYGHTFAHVPKTTSMFRLPANPDVSAVRDVKHRAARSEALARAKRALQAIDQSEP